MGSCVMAEGNGEAVTVPASGAANGLSNGAGGTSAQPNNPLSRKLYKILETRLDNDKVTGDGWTRDTRHPRAEAGPGGLCPAPSARPGGHPRPSRGGWPGEARSPGKGKRRPGPCSSLKRFLDNFGSGRKTVGSLS